MFSDIQKSNRISKKAFKEREKGRIKGSKKVYIKLRNQYL